MFYFCSDRYFSERLLTAFVFNPIVWRVTITLGSQIMSRHNGFLLLERGKTALHGDWPASVAQVENVKRIAPTDVVENRFAAVLSERAWIEANGY